MMHPYTIRHGEKSVPGIPFQSKPRECYKKVLHWLRNAASPMYWAWCFPHPCCDKGTERRCNQSTISWLISARRHIGGWHQANYGRWNGCAWPVQNKYYIRTLQSPVEEFNSFWWMKRFATRTYLDSWTNFHFKYWHAHMLFDVDVSFQVSPESMSMRRMMESFKYAFTEDEGLPMLLLNKYCGTLITQSFRKHCL